MGRKKNPNSVSNYFNESVEQAIQLYNLSETQEERDKHFIIIYPAIYKIAEVFFNKVKPTYISDEALNVILDCTAYLSERLFRIKEGKGKAFSYLTVCARNYYIFHNMAGYKDTNQVVSLDYVNENWDINDIDDNRVEEMEEAAELLNAFADYLERNQDNFSTGAVRKAKPVVIAVVNLIRNIDNIEDFNRRNIMNNLTDIDGMKVDRHYITKMFNKLQIHYGAFKKEWMKSKGEVQFLKSDLNPTDIQFCINNFAAKKGKYSIAGLAKRFNVEEYTVRKHLSKAGLCSI